MEGHPKKIKTRDRAHVPRVSRLTLRRFRSRGQRLSTLHTRSRCAGTRRTAWTSKQHTRSAHGSPRRTRCRAPRRHAPLPADSWRSRDWYDDIARRRSSTYRARAVHEGIEHAIGCIATQAGAACQGIDHESRQVRNSSIHSIRKSVPPSSAASVAACEIVLGFDVLCDCGVCIARISHAGPPASRCASPSSNTPSIRG
ncbi:hypothetical protein AWB65_06747 [Caballeronia humi]|uniref:Uncharacterized protein n=1 Tax=Caballeronia humi TaxID=326474 RepID=A0A158JIP4_9BURK|nr:hypothetical protein AWB65_06747 [Caballeronia humi]